MWVRLRVTLRLITRAYLTRWSSPPHHHLRRRRRHDDQGKKTIHRSWLERHEVNAFLKRAQKSNRFREMSVERLGQVYGLLMVEEEEKERLTGEVRSIPSRPDRATCTITLAHSPLPLSPSPLPFSYPYLETPLPQVRHRDDQIEHLSRKNAYLQDKLGSEEDAKRRTLLRYVNAVKAAAVASGTDPQGFPTDGGGVIQLPESGITDEEVRNMRSV